MNNVCRLACVLGLTLAGCLWAQEPLEIEVQALGPDAVFEYEEETGTITDPTGVVVKYGEAELAALKVRLNRETAEVTAEGNVRFQRGRALWTGASLQYNFATGQMGSARFRTGQAPYFVAGEGLASDPTNQVHSATNVFVTTDDLAEPGYRVRARSLRFIPGELIEARQATLYLGKVPVMYLPRYRRLLRRHDSYWVVLPGYRSLHGPFLLSTYNWSARSNLTVLATVDYRQRRGVAGGPGLTYDLGRYGTGQVRAYGAEDEEPGLDAQNHPIDSQRYRLSFTHAIEAATNLTAKAALRAQSDAEIVRDFFESEYRHDPQPRSFLEVNQHWSNFSLDVLAQAQVNDFFQTVERLPDLKLTAFRQQLGVSPFYYEGENSAGYFRYRTPEAGGANFAAFRADTFHQLLLPQHFWGWLNVTPRVGGRFSYYSEQEGENTQLSSASRSVLNTGAELSTKASKVWRGVRSSTLDLTELRHIVEPSVNYVYVPNPSRSPGELPQFDYELQSLRLPPIDFPDYSSIDSIDTQNVLRLGLKNRLQTKRLAGIENFVNWALYTDWRLDPRPGQSTFADLFSDLDLQPRSWLTLNSETRFDLRDGVCRLASHTASLWPSSAWSWKVGHRYLQDGLLQDTGNNLLLSSFLLRFNENWAFRLSHHFEARDGTMEEQYYTVYRDLRSWTAALTLRLRDSRVGRDDVTVAISFSLKALPRFKVGEERDHAERLLGY